MKLRGYCWLAAVLLSGTLGCIHTPVAMSASTKPLAPDGYQELGPVVESDCAWALFGLIPITGPNSMQAATNDAIARKRGADALIQVTAETFYAHYIVVDRRCTKISGIAVKSTQSAHRADAAGPAETSRVTPVIEPGGATTSTVTGGLPPATPPDPYSTPPSTPSTPPGTPASPPAATPAPATPPAAPPPPKKPRGKK